MAVVNKLKQTGRHCRIWGSHNSGYEDLCLLGYNTMQSVESQLTFGGTCQNHLQGKEISKKRNQC
jgi:hypothetical protein